MSTTVAFPAVGSAVPNLMVKDKPLTPEDFAQQVMHHQPHWLIHLSIEATLGGFSSQGFSPAPPHLLETLYRQLGLPPGGIALQPREFLHGALRHMPERSPYAFGLPAMFPGRSSLLAVAVGMVAAVTGDRLPPWVLFSGVVDDSKGALPLESTGDLRQKVLMAFGCDPEYASLPLLELLYQTGTTEAQLGPFEERVRPGRVRLFVTSTTVDTHPPEFVTPLSAEMISRPLEWFGDMDFARLEQELQGLVGDGMVLAQVPTVFHALRLLGYHRHLPAIEQRRLANSGSVFFYHVRHSGLSRPRQILGLGSQAVAEVAALEPVLASAKDCRRRLHVILDRCMKLLHCNSGDISVCRGEHWLEVFCREAPDGPPTGFAPAQLGITGRVIRTGEPAVVGDTSEDPDHLAAQAPSPQAEQVYGEQAVHAYQQQLPSIRACVELPLRDAADKVVGLLCLRRDAKTAFEPGLIALVRHFAGRAAQEVARYLDEEQAVANRPATFVERPERHLTHLPRSGAQANLGAELARHAWRLSGGYRAGVRLITPDHRGLVPIGHAGAPGMWPADFLGRCLRLDEDPERSAAQVAIRTNKNHIIPDTDAPDTGPYLDVPPRGRSHGAILLRASGHTLGVLSVDWTQPDGCPPGIEERLTALAGRYAVVLKAFAVDDLFAQLDRVLAETGPSQRLDFARCLDLVALMVGGRQGAIFLHRPRTDRLHLAASLLHPEWSADEFFYEWGQGVTGWLARRNRPVRIADLSDRKELAALDPADPPLWLNRHYDGLDRDDHNYTYLGVPLAVGSRVFGVLRLSSTDADSFSAYDLQIALAAAGRIAGWLSQLEQRHRESTLLHLLGHWLGWMDGRGDSLDAIAGSLSRLLPAGVSCLWGTAPRDGFCPLLASCNADRDEFPEPTQAALWPALTAPYVIDRSATDNTLRALADSFPPSVRGKIQSRPRIALTLSAGGWPVALFFHVPHSPQPLDDEVMDLLGRLAEVLRRGGQLAGAIPKVMPAEA